MGELVPGTNVPPAPGLAPVPGVKPTGPYSTRKLPGQPWQTNVRLAEVGEVITRLTIKGALQPVVKEPIITGPAVPLAPQYSPTQTSYVVPAVRPLIVKGKVGRQPRLVPVPTVGAVDGLGKTQYSDPVEQFPPGVQVSEAEVAVVKLVTKLVGFGQPVNCQARVKLPEL